MTTSLTLGELTNMADISKKKFLASFYFQLLALQWSQQMSSKQRAAHVTIISNKQWWRAIRLPLLLTAVPLVIF